jgi:hypothetical protein
MFRNQTVVVLGAGASSECNLPTGAELRMKIASLLDIRFKYGYEQQSGDYEIVHALKVATKGGDINPYLHAGQHIRKAMPQAISIDNFIDIHQGNGHLELIGKLAIVKAILNGERSSPLYFDPTGSLRRPDFSKLKDIWHNSFMQLLSQNCPITRLPERLSKLSFVIFNYDRCAEYFLYHSIQNVYGVDPSQAAELLKAVTFLHPYGVVGSLPWQRGDISIEYGGEVSGGALLSLSGGIKTFTEGTDPSSSDILKIREQITQASTLLFLGFAYHPQNLELLQSPNPHPDASQVKYFGTAYGMSTNDCELVRADLVKLASAQPNNIAIRSDMTCFNMLKDYWRSLSLT